MFSFGLKSKEKWVFFVTFFFLQEKKNDKNLPDHTHQSYYQSLSLSLATFAVNFSHQTTISNGFFAG